MKLDGLKFKTVEMEREPKHSKLNDYAQMYSVCHISVISPHLDDAAFSLATFLMLPELPPRDVFTVFTKARADSDPRHALAMGFNNPVIEFEARRSEDKKAMEMLGVSFFHLDAETDRFTSENGKGVVERIIGDKRPEELLILLPVGAGGELNGYERFFRWLKRVPTGCPPHFDHLQVRDVLWQILVLRGVRIGFYAEVPYQWADSQKHMMNLLAGISQQSFVPVRVEPDIVQKLAVAKTYTSQFKGEFGFKPYYQRRVIAIPELLFLPK